MVQYLRRTAPFAGPGAPVPSRVNWLVKVRISRIHIGTILSQQSLAVLSTQRDGQPYTNLMAFANSEDLSEFVVATGTSTRKYQNLMMDSRVSLLLDNRSNKEDDFHSAEALTVLGVANAVDERVRIFCEDIFIKKHPYLQHFIQAPTTRFFKITVKEFIHLF